MVIARLAGPVVDGNPPAPRLPVAAGKSHLLREKVVAASESIISELDIPRSAFGAGKEGSKHVFHVSLGRPAGEGQLIDETRGKSPMIAAWRAGEKPFDSRRRAG
ncbi:hypothetical protein [Arthrobacter sp. efr-133-R2A-120]|uniref:hypothetical protein n=1 Tax=Arthrobacter sp. efr-133-R2A-120 TaxID=3040277 RepID=UPI0004B27415|nr:hypothetical protein [Arthrobacter sp. efr-133-R2A-120]